MPAPTSPPLPETQPAAGPHIPSQEAEPEDGGGVERILVHLWRAESCGALLEIDRDARIIKAGSCALDQPGAAVRWRGLPQRREAWGRGRGPVRAAAMEIELGACIVELRFLTARGHAAFGPCEEACLCPCAPFREARARSGCQGLFFWEGDVLVAAYALSSRGLAA